MSLAAFLQAVVGLLDDSGVPYMLTAALASAYYAVPRATQDLDVVIAFIGIATTESSLPTHA